MTAVDTISAVLRRAAAAWPDHEALISAEERITYRDYSARVELLSRALIASGIEMGDRVAIWAPNSIEFAIAAFAIHSTGAAVVPINTRFRQIEAEDILRRSGARAVFAFSDFLGRDYLAELADTSVLDQMAFAVSLRGAPTKVGLSLKDLLQRADAVSPEQQHERESVITPDTLSDVIFTSGTTGRPKGAMLAHGPSVRGFTEYGRSLALSDQDRLLGIPPFFHTFGLKGGLLSAAIVGAGMVPMAVFDVHEAARLIEAEHVTVLQGAPTIFLDLINTPDIDHTGLTSLRVAAPGAANMVDAYFERIRDELNIHQFANGYALTESHAIGTRVYPWDDFETAATSCGRPGPGIDLRIADENGMTLPAGKAGEIQFRGYNVMLGYFDDPDATAAAIDAQGWLHTGDIGYLDELGRLHVNDRMKDMFIVGGFNTYPAEIEGLLSRHPAIAEVAVVGVPDERMGEVGKAFVVLGEGGEVNGEDIIEFAFATMANYKVPREVVILDELPRNASGKITKFRLREIKDDPRGVA
jgi:HIP---CoA ligase